MVHQFGIMDEVDEQKEYVEYAPRQYDCVAVHDDMLSSLEAKLSGIRTYFHLGISTSLFENVRTIGWLTEIVWTDKLKITEDRRYEDQVTRNDSSSPWTTAGAGSIRSR